MNNILTPTELQGYKDIGNKIDENKINPIIEQAQITELKAILGDRFYFDLLSNLENPIYQPLLSGCSFTYYGVNYYQDGIKTLLADYFMSKYVLQINTNITAFGATTKASNDSEPTDRNSLKDISTQQSLLAYSRWETIKIYLDANTAIFPIWQNNVFGDEANLSENKRYRFRKI